jgi:hypothetical protein
MVFRDQFDLFQIDTDETSSNGILNGRMDAWKMWSRLSEGDLMESEFGKHGGGTFGNHRLAAPLSAM